LCSGQSINADEPPPFGGMDEIGGATLPPGHTQFTQHTLVVVPFDSDGRFCLTPVGASTLLSASFVILAYGTIEYEDVFGEPRRTDYRMFHTNQWPLIGGRGGMRFSGKGNRDT
jgi:hypothetical protein